MNSTPGTTGTDFLDRPGGRIAFETRGDGPHVALVPGMGDLRSTYRYLVPALVDAGYHVTAMDLRGHGDIDTTFDAYDDEAAIGDVAELIRHIGGPAVIVGNSMGAAAAAGVAADHPELVDGIVLVGPFLREPKTGAVARVLTRVAMLPFVAATSWKLYLPRLYAGRKPEDFDSYVGSVVSAIRRKGYAATFSKTTRSSHAPVEARLDRVKTPSLVVMGELDPDFPSPAGEAQWIAERLDADVVMVPEAGHYPQSQRPDVVTPAVLAFLDRVVGRA